MHHGSTITSTAPTTITSVTTCSLTNPTGTSAETAKVAGSVETRVRLWQS